MCQAKPGPRCFNDSDKKLSQLAQKLTKAKKEMSELNKQLTNDPKSFMSVEGQKQSKKLFEKRSALTARVTELELEVRHTQRDLDSTLTGRKKLNEALKGAKTTQEREDLERRRRSAEALRFNREHALERLKSGTPALINIRKAA